MLSGRHRELGEAIGRFEVKMRRLADLGVDLRRPTGRMLDDLRVRKDELRRQHEELEATQHDADRLLMADLLDLYLHGCDADREWLREVLREHRTFRWGFGWGLGQRIATAEDARKALAVFSMKDGDSDWRDQIVALDHLCAAMRKAGLPLAALLTEAAAWSSDITRFPGASSTCGLLLRYAARFKTIG